MTCFLGAARACTKPLFFISGMLWVLTQVFLSKRKIATYMLSQNLVSVLGFSWLRLCRNQRWMLRTSQSNCLESPSNLFSSGCCETRYQENHFHLYYKQTCPTLHMRFFFFSFCIYYLLLRFLHLPLRTCASISNMNINNQLWQEKLFIVKQHWKIWILL